MGALSAFYFKTTKHQITTEIQIFFSFAFASFLVAELCHFSGIISCLLCGVMMRQFTLRNMHASARLHALHVIHFVAGVTETTIFFSLGVAAGTTVLILLHSHYCTHTTVLILLHSYYLIMHYAAVLQFKWFSVSFFWGTVFACLVARAASIFGLSFLVNAIDKLGGETRLLSSIHDIPMKHQVMIPPSSLTSSLSPLTPPTLSPTSHSHNHNSTHYHSPTR
jgi:NhaP-type Na+/H+ or K+/H+ antiporter